MGYEVFAGSHPINIERENISRQADSHYSRPNLRVRSRPSREKPENIPEIILSTLAVDVN